jgi:hypothetical protein
MIDKTMCEVLYYNYKLIHLTKIRVLFRQYNMSHITYDTFFNMIPLIRGVRVDRTVGKGVQDLGQDRTVGTSFRNCQGKHIFVPLSAYILDP